MRLLVALGVTAAVVVGVYFVVAGSSPSTPSVQVRSSDWVIGSPRAEGFQPVRFARAIARVGREEPGMMALLVARHGRLVLERYYHEATRSTGFDVYSITKTITSALVGIAIYQRRIPSVDASLARFFGNEVPR